MIVAGSASPLLLSSSGYNLTNSLRFRSSASAYLNRTFTTPTNNKKWTYSCWIKRGRLSTATLGFFGQQTNSSNRADLYFDANDNLNFYNLVSGTAAPNPQWITTQVFRDPSAWYHIVVVWDSDNATAGDRTIIYVNGTRITAYSQAGTVSLGQSSQINSANGHSIGRFENVPAYFDGYMAEINFIDGQALTPSSFGQTSATTGVWIPKKYTGTYGTNGFYLPFTDNSGATSTTIGKDFSGNGNNWTPNNISVTVGITYDSMTDVPTLTSATAANYATLNPVSPLASGSITNANLTFTSGAGDAICQGTFGMSSGKWYWEVTATNVNASLSAIGIIGQPPASLTVDLRTPSNGYCYISNGNKGNNNTTSSYGATYTSGDVIGIALDMDAGTLVFYKNNSSQGTAYSSLTGTFTPALSDLSGSSSGAVFDCNFGQRPFSYTPPTGFKALNTFNLPTPTIGATASTQANDYFNAITWTGTGGTRSITGVGFQPDFVWAKARSQAYSNIVFDSVRGVGKSLLTDTTGAEATNEANGYISSFDTDGFSSNFSAAANYYFNQSGTTYVAWNWKANGSGSTNTAGTITSTVSANTSAGFSIVTYTGNATIGATIGHGLGVAPSMLIVKQRTGGTEAWQVYHSALGATKYLELNNTNAAGTNINRWNNTAPTSTVFTVYNDTINNGNTNTYVAYCFAQVAGYSAFGSYTGNGSSDGPFVYTGFRPRFFMIKRTDTTTNWIMYDTARMPYNTNPVGPIYANLSSAEESNITLTAFDILSNGFKPRNTSSWAESNASGGTYIYMAFAESPFKYANAR
jgi:hypothetical protein